MKIIDLVRHGEPDTSIHDDFLRPLTLTGIRQAEMVSSKLQKQPYTHIFASPLRRSVETVVPLAKKQNISVETNNLLVERKMPEWFDSSQKFTDYINHQWIDFKYYQAGGESLQHAQTRYISFIKDKCKDDEHIAIGSHGTVMSTIYELVHPGEGFEFWESLPYGSTLRLKVNHDAYIYAELV